MQFSAADLPTGPQEVRQHIESGKKLGSPRTAAVIPITSDGGRCAHCGLSLRDNIKTRRSRSDSKYCDSACKTAAYRARRVRKAA
jgi:hypothetical protein